MKKLILIGALALAGCSQIADPYAVAGNCPVPGDFWNSEPVYQRMEQDTGERFARTKAGVYMRVGRGGNYDCAVVLKIAGRP